MFDGFSLLWITKQDLQNSGSYAAGIHGGLCAIGVHINLLFADGCGHQGLKTTALWAYFQTRREAFINNSGDSQSRKVM